MGTLREFVELITQCMSIKSEIEPILQPHPVVLEPSVFVNDAVAAMAQSQVSCALIYQQQQLIGIVTERDIVRVVAQQKNPEKLTVAEIMTQPVITISISDIDSIFSISRLFSKHQIRHLPVIDEQSQVLGVITPHDVRHLLRPEHLLRHLRVNEVMVTSVFTGSPEDSIYGIAQQMADHQVSCVVIVNSHGSRPMGIVTERDIVQYHAMGLDFGQLTAEVVMSQPLTTVQPQEYLWAVHQHMQRLRVRRLVVSDSNGLLAGIVTQTQLLKLLDPIEMFNVMEQMQQTIDQQVKELQSLNLQLQQTNQDLEQLASMDQLTRIANRRQFDEYLQSEWARCNRVPRYLSLILCDIDFFKAYNDTYGHPAGDACLVQVAQILSRAAKRCNDKVARYGGEEFAFILPDTDRSGAECVAQRILQLFEQSHLPHGASKVATYVTVSIGISTMLPEQIQPLPNLIAAADKALYQSKQGGRKTYRWQPLGQVSEL